MPRWTQLTIYQTLVAVGLIALNLGAALAVSRAHPRAWAHVRSRGKATWVVYYRKDGLTCRGTDGLGVTLALQEPLPETRLQVWSPVVASMSITVLVLALSWSGPPSPRRSARSYADEGPSTRPPQRRQTTGWAVIAIALVGLNLAGAMYSPTPGDDEAELAQQYFNERGIYLIKADGTFEFQRQGLKPLLFTRTRVPGPGQPFSRLAARDAAINGIEVTTLVLGDDGSILGYGGRAGDVTTTPIVLRPPLRSVWEMRWPVMASVLITALVFAVLWRRARRRRLEDAQACGSRAWTGPASRRSMIAWALIATVFICLNGAAAVATWRAHPLEQAGRVRATGRFGWDYEALDSVPVMHGSRRMLGTLEGGERLLRILLFRGRPRLVETWSPVIASASVTLLVLIILLGGSHQPCRNSDPGAASGHPSRRSGLGPARWAAIAALLLALNVAGAVYGPYPQPGDEQPPPWEFEEPPTFPDRHGYLLDCVPGGAGELVRRPASGGPGRRATAGDFPSPRCRVGPRELVLDTIVYNSDGSVVAYEGKAGLLDRLFSRPQVIQPPTRSFIEVWWPVLGSASITVVILGLAWWQARGRSPGLTSANDAHVDRV